MEFSRCFLPRVYSKVDSVADIQPIDQSAVRSEGLVGEKRPVENGEGSELEVPLQKKVRSGGELGGDMKQVAEIVLVLATMGKIRAGRSPTVVEIEMMVKAREKLVEACQGFAPKDVFPRDAFGMIIEDLGLSKLREQRLGFRPPRMSIAEKYKLSKQKLEKSEDFSLHSAMYSSQRLETNLGAAAEGRGTSPAVRMFPSDKPSHAPISLGGFQPASPLGHAPAANSTSLPYQLPTSRVRPMVSSGLPSGHLGRDSSSLALPRVERSHIRLDGKSNGSSNSSQLQANSSGDNTIVKTPTWSMQPQSASSAKFRSDNNVPAHISIKVEGSTVISTSQVAPQVTTSKPIITQTTSRNPPSIQQNLQGMNIQAPSLCHSHNEIGKIVQKLLQPQLPKHPTWSPPSRDYMNKALTCQKCKFTINEVDSVLICDACEKGYHLKCLQFHNQKSIPRAEWHCGQCLAVSNGKAWPPKYGRVMRNAITPQMSSNATAVQSSSGKKVGPLDEKVNQQRITANGISGLQSTPTGIGNNNYSHSESGLKMAETREIQGKDILSSCGKLDEKPPGTCSMKTSGPASPSADLPAVISCEEKRFTESESQPPAKSETVVNLFGHSQGPGNPEDNDQIGLPNSAEIPSKQCHDTNLMVEESKKSYNAETLDCNPNNEIKEDKQGVALANPIETSGISIGVTEHARSSSDALHDVVWIGDVLQVVDEKTHYQSCCINGVVYKVQSYALFRSDTNKLMPFKLQAMWEDSKTRLKWVIVNRCYLPGDLPEVVGCPCAPESNEVYESNHDSMVMAGLIQGPCEVLPPSKFIEESERRSHLWKGTNDGLRSLFLCKWFYDKTRGLFRDVCS